MTKAVRLSFILRQPDYVFPATFGMFSDAGNKKVLNALQTFIAHPEVVAASKMLKSPADRLGAFQDSSVESTEGHTYFEYFGYTNNPGAA